MRTNTFKLTLRTNEIFQHSYYVNTPEVKSFQEILFRRGGSIVSDSSPRGPCYINPEAQISPHA